MTKILIPSSGPCAWRQFLADPKKQWQKGFSARTLAHSWEAAQGLPPEIESLFQACPDLGEEKAELLLAIPEHKVPLPGGGRASQVDVFALVRCGTKTVALAVEGKVDEPFGPSVEAWLKGASEGKTKRLAYLRELLGLTADLPGELRYQLLHRAAAAVIEAERFKTDAAAMIVHTFSERRTGLYEYDRFVEVMEPDEKVGELVACTLPGGRRLYLGLARGDRRFLKA